MGLWYSPFLLETVGVKEPPDPGSIPGPATRLDTQKGVRFPSKGTKGQFKTS